MTLQQANGGKLTDRQAAAISRMMHAVSHLFIREPKSIKLRDNFDRGMEAVEKGGNHELLIMYCDIEW